ERTHRAFAEDGQRDALPNHALRPAVFYQRRLRVVEHVDEARSDREAGRVDFLATSRRGQVATGGDPIALNRPVLDGAGGSGSVVDRTVSDHEVVLRRPRAPGAGEQQEQRNAAAHRSVTARGTPPASIVAGGWMS